MSITDSAMLIKQIGIEGDRYATNHGFWSKQDPAKRNISLIAIESFIGENSKLPIPFVPMDTRRNILTAGIPNLGMLIGKRFMIGQIELIGIEICIPCDRPNKLSGKTGFVQAFPGAKAGLRAKILSDGCIIRVGDLIEICPELVLT